ncbi:MAG: YggU family protein [Anaerolineae bacterium]|nr:YggU family protein [Anaerolineae bacterium]
MPRDFNITSATGGAAFTVKIVPKANRTEIVGVQEDGTIKIRLMSPPIEGQANEELINFLADFLGCNKRDIEIVAGAEGRKKLISVLNVDAGRVNDLVRAVVPESFVDDTD